MNLRGWCTVLLIVSLAGCVSKDFPPAADGKITAITTLFPLYEFAFEVGGNKTRVLLLLPPGAEPHTFEPTPKDILKISDADIFVYNGAGMEPWINDILEGVENKELLTVDSSQHVTLIKTEEHEEDEHDHGEYDPHIWLNFENDQRIVDAIAAAMSEKDPESRDYYATNAEEYKKKLVALDERYETGLANCTRREFISGGHAAFAYLTERYNLVAVAAYDVSADSEPTPKRIKEITDLSKEHGIKYILFEKLVNPKIAEAIAEESGVKTLAFNPGHNINDLGKETFISLMDDNLNVLRTALECS